MFYIKVIFWLKKSKFSLKMTFFGVHFTKIVNPLNSKAEKKVWHAACGPQAALWPCLLYKSGKRKIKCVRI